MDYSDLISRGEHSESWAAQELAESLTVVLAERDAAREVTCALAEADPIVYEDAYLTCHFCGRHQGPNEPGPSPHHDEDCLWRQAQQVAPR